jgi:hypothetical protein
MNPAMMKNDRKIRKTRKKIFMMAPFEIGTIYKNKKLSEESLVVFT